MKQLGIDEKESGTGERSTWKGVKDFFEKKLPELKEKMNTCVGPGGYGKQLLLKSVLEEVIITVERQLSDMDIFTDAEADVTRLEYAPVTNSGCESEFGKLDNRLHVSGGSATVQTLSMENIVSTNKLLSDQSFKELSEDEEMEQWEWARKSQEVQETSITEGIS